MRNFVSLFFRATGAVSCCRVLLGVIMLSVFATSYANGQTSQSSTSSVSIARGVTGLTAKTLQKADGVTAEEVNNWTESLVAGFVPNQGQIANTDGKTASTVLYAANVKGVQVYVTTSGISHYFLKRVRKEGERREVAAKSKEPKLFEWCRLDMVLKDATIRPDRIRLEDPITELGTLNYYLPQCPDGVLNVPTYGKVTFSDVYPGIDWVVLSRPGEGVQHDFVVHPGADLTNIRLEYNGASSIEVSDDLSQLRVKTPLGEVQEGALNCYQGAQQSKVRGRYQADGNAVSFLIDQYDQSIPLVIDPPLVWGTYYGGFNYDGPRTIYCDNANDFVYVVGYTASTNLPLQNPGGGVYYQGTLSGGLLQDAFIWKFNQSGVRLWATYYGGSEYETNTDCALDNFGNIYICGNTTSPDFPTQNLGGAYNQGVGANLDAAYILKFNSLGVRQWATHYGGNGQDQATGIATDATGKVYVCGLTQSSDLPLVNPGGGAYFQSSVGVPQDGFILRFSALGALEWATYLGGAAGIEEAYGITTTTNSLYVTGFTQSASFPTLNPGGVPFSRRRSMAHRMAL